MGRFLAWSLCLIGTICVAWLITFDIPVLTGMVYIDGPDPERPGHLMGVGPTLLGFACRIIATVGGVSAALWLSKHREQN